MESYKMFIKATKERKREEDKNKNKGNRWKMVTNMVSINPAISVVTLNNNGLNIPMKTQRFQSGSKNKTQLYTVFKKIKHFKYKICTD